MPTKRFSPRLWVELAALGALLLAIGLPRGLELGRFVTPDEHLWLTRSANFYYALSKGDLTSTYQMGHPGVMVMWAGTAGFLYRYPEYRSSHIGQLDPSEFHQYLKRKSEDVSPLEILSAGRLFVVLAHTLTLLGAYGYARRLLGSLPALVGMLLVAFDPFHIALNRVLHLDGLYSNLALLSVLACVGYLQSRKGLDLSVSAAAAGLAWLTKSPALFLIPVIALLILLDALRTALPVMRFSIKSYWKPALMGAAWLACAAGVFVAAWPAMWVNPVETLVRVFGMAQQFSESGHESALFFNGLVVRDGNFGPPLFYFYPLTYLWRATPLTLLGLVLAAGFAITRKAPFDRPDRRAAALGLLLFVLVFAIGLTLPAKKFDRYLLPVYAPLDILAGLGWFALAHWLAEKKTDSLLRFAPHALLAVVLGLQAASAMGAAPYYFTYYNPLMGGAAQAPNVMQVGWGEGLDEAARYLNQKPQAGKLQVMTIHSTGCFSYYFRGRDRSFSYNSTSSEAEWQTFNASDYALVYISQRQRDLSAPILQRLAGMTPEKTIWLDGIEYVRIYKLR